MSELMKFENDWSISNDVKSFPNKGMTRWHGYVYIIEYGEGIKIGCSKQPSKRINAIKSHARNYSDIIIGRIAVSTEHTNYKENEEMLHKHFGSFRKAKSEIFRISFGEALSSLPRSIEYLDESADKEIDCNKRVDFLKNTLFGGAI